MSKYFIIDEKPKKYSKKERLQMAEERLESEKMMGEVYKKQRDINKEWLVEEDSLRHSEGRVIVKVDLKSKKSHTFESGMEISLEREYNNFNLREVNPVNCTVISGENIPKGTEIIVDYTCVQETYQINSYKETSVDIKYYSIPTILCYLYKDKSDNWKALTPYETALRVFEPYNGAIQNIAPNKLKDTLYVTSGCYKGLVVKTLIGCDYQVVFQDSNGREGNIIRFLPDGDEGTKKESEAIAILNDATEKVNNGELLIGITISDAKKLNEYGK